MCAGSLMCGCSFDVTCFSFHSELGRGCCQIWCPKRVIWHACCARFGTMGTIERCRGTWEHTEGDLGIPGLDFHRFGRAFGAAIWTFLVNFGTTIFFLACVLAGHVFQRFWGVNLDVWGSRIKHLVWKVLQKPAFHICRDYVDFGVIFTWFSMALGPFLMTFGGLGPGLKFYDFRWFSRGSRS